MIYKVKKGVPKGLRQESSGKDSDVLRGESLQDNVEIESDPEILDLKKELRKAELRKQLAETNAPINMESRIAAMEDKMAEMKDILDFLFDENMNIKGLIYGTPLSGLLDPFECACGAKGKYSLIIQCDECGEEYSCRKLPQESYISESISE